jgi:hypothetical protein
VTMAVTLCSLNKLFRHYTIHEMQDELNLQTLLKVFIDMT